MILPAGKYVICDLCYVIEDNEIWQDLVNLWFSDNNTMVNGIIEYREAKIVCFGTTYGDGIYYDNYGNEYPVDSGSIGIISLEDLAKLDGDAQGYNVVEFKVPFSCVNTNGDMYFGHVHIDTGDHYEDEDDEEY